MKKYSAIMFFKNSMTAQLRQGEMVKYTGPTVRYTAGQADRLLDDTVLKSYNKKHMLRDCQRIYSFDSPLLALARGGIYERAF